MSTHLVAFPSVEGAEVLVEVRSPPQQGGMRRIARADGVVATATQTFEAAISQIRPVAARVMQTLRELNNPDELSIEFGVNLTAEAGAIIASATAEANFKISMVWKRSE